MNTHCSMENFHQPFIGKKKQSRRSTNSMYPVQVERRIEIPLESEVKILVTRKPKSDKQVCQTKKDDIKSMLKLMPVTDRQNYNSIGITEN